MSGLVDVGVVTVRRKMFPYFIIAAVLALAAAGSSGMYFGYRLSEANNYKERIDLASAYNSALVEKEARRKEAESRSRMIEGTFLAALNGLKGDNKQALAAVLEETKKEIYATCRVPDTGVDILNNRIDGVNRDILGRPLK